MLALGADTDCEYDKTDICRDCVWSEVERTRRFLGRLTKANLNSMAIGRNEHRAHQEALENYNSLKDVEHIDVDAETYLVSGQWLKGE